MSPSPEQRHAFICDSLPLDNHFPLFKSLDIPPAWEAAAARFLEAGGTVMILGGPDSGKSTLSRYLVSRACEAGAPAALMDLDLGQSHVGPPAALGLALFPPRLPGDDPLFPEGLYFVGQTSPVGAVLEVAVGARVLADQARAAGATHVVVNTSGLVAGGVAARLKRAEVELLRPRLLLALEREAELGPLLPALGAALEVVRLPVSDRAVGRSMEARRLYRETRFAAYFRPAKLLHLATEQVTWRGPFWEAGRRLTPGEAKELARRLGCSIYYGEISDRHLVLITSGGAPAVAPQDLPPLHHISLRDLRHRLVGLLDGGHRTLSLGLLPAAPWKAGAWQVLAPLPVTRGREVRFLALGRLRLTPDGRELGHEKDWH